MRFLLTILLIACTLPTFAVSQIDSWKEVLNIGKVTAALKDSVTQINPETWPAVYHDSCIVFAVRRTIFDPNSGSHTDYIEVFESRDVGETYDLIGHFTTWPWKDGVADVTAIGLYYMQSGDIVIRSDQHFLRYQHSSKTWGEVWSAWADLREYDYFVPPFAKEDLIISSVFAQTGLLATQDSDTLRQFEIGDNLGVTPTNVLFGYARRRILFADNDDVHANFNTLERRSPMCIWSPALGLAFSGSLLADDECRQWEKLYPYDSTIRLAAVAQNGTFMAFANSFDNNEILVSTDLGQRWERARVPSDSTNDRMWLAYNVGGRNLFLGQWVSGSLKMAVCSSMSADIRWPRDSALERLSAQTLLCPEKLAGEIEVEIDDQEDFASPHDHAITTERYHLVHDLSPRTMYWWRYRYRPAPDSNWHAWSAPWHFSTGACTRWKYMHAPAPVDPWATGPTHYTRMLDGTLVRIEFGVKTVFTSRDQGNTWDSIATFQELSNPVFRESPSGALIGQSGGRWFSLDLHTRTITWRLKGYDNMEVFGNRLIAFSRDSVTTSTDEGETWKRLPNLKRLILSVYADVDGSILLGCTDLLYKDNDTSKNYRQLCLFRYSPNSDSLTQLTFEKRPYDNGTVDGLDRVRRFADGHLYAVRGQEKRRDILRSTDDGRTWTSVLPTFLRGDSLTDLPPYEFLTDRDQLPVMVMADHHHRRLYNGNWETIDDGFQVRGSAVPMNSRSYKTLPDGTWSYTYGPDTWMCVQDPSIDQIKPRVKQVFQPNEEVTLQWNAANGARFYTVEIEPGNRTYQTTSAAPMFTAPTLVSGRYTWRTRAHFDVGTGPWTATSMFSIAGSTTSMRADDPSPSDRMNASILTREVLQRRIHEMDVQPCFTDLSGRLIERWEDVPTPVLLIMVTGATQHLIIVQE